MLEYVSLKCIEHTKTEESVNDGKEENESTPSNVRHGREHAEKSGTESLDNVNQANDVNMQELREWIKKFFYKHRVRCADMSRNRVDDKIMRMRMDGPVGWTHSAPNSITVVQPRKRVSKDA